MARCTHSVPLPLKGGIGYGETHMKADIHPTYYPPRSIHKCMWSYLFYWFYKESVQVEICAKLYTSPRVYTGAEKEF